MGLKSYVERAIFLRWLRGKVKDWRTKEGVMRKVLAFLDGWKLLIAVFVLFICGMWDASHNGHATSLVGAVFSVLGWAPPGEWTGDAMTKAVASGLGLWAFGDRLYKAWRQKRAGASVGELLSEAGYVKKAAETGSIGSILSTPATIVRLVSLPKHAA